MKNYFLIIFISLNISLFCNYESEVSWQEFHINFDSLPQLTDLEGKRTSAHLKAMLECINKHDETCPAGYILQGPPGTGKSTAPKALAAASNATCLYITGSDFNVRIIGNGTYIIEKLFNRAKELAELGKVIVFIDEIDGIAHRSSDEHHQDETRTCNKLLAEVCNLHPNIKVIGTTNYSSKIDEALIRHGRLKILNFELPDQSDRLAILTGKAQKYMSEDAKIKKEVNNYLQKISKETKNYHPAALNHLVLVAAKYGNNIITKESLQKAFEETKNEFKEYLKHAENKEKRERRKEEIEEEQLKNLKYNNSWKATAWDLTKTAILVGIKFI